MNDSASSGNACLPSPWCGSCRFLRYTLLSCLKTLFPNLHCQPLFCLQFWKHFFFPLNNTFCVAGGGIFGLLSKNHRFGRNPVVMLGIVVHFIAFYLIFYNMPNDAPLASMRGTDSIAYMEPRYKLFFLFPLISHGWILEYFRPVTASSGHGW